MKRSLCEICNINADSLSAKDTFLSILYLDTSSITCNSISSIQYLKLEDLPSRAKRKVKHNTIVYSSVRPNLKHYGILKNPSENLIVSTGFVTLDVKEEFVSSIDADFVYYLLSNQNIVDYLSTLAESAVSAYPSIIPSDIGNLVFDFPEISIQRELVSKIKPLDQKVALNTRMNAELEAMAKQLYDYWFVQFDFPDENGKPYKSSGGKMVYNETLKRDIPEGWEVKLLTDVLGEKKSGDWGQDKEQGIYTLKVNCIRGADLKDPLNAPKRFINQKNSNRLLDANDIIVEISGGSPVQATGRSLYVTDGLLDRYNKKLTCSNFCQALKVLDNELSSYFYYTWNLFYDNNIMFNFEGKTSGIKNLLIDMLLGTSWYFPPASIYKKFESLIQRLFKQIDSNKIENQELTHLRDSLLPMLMNGQIIIE